MVRIEKRPADPRGEKHPEVPPAKAQFLSILDDLCQHVEGVARRREMLLHVLDLIDRQEAGGIMDAVVQGRGVLNTVTDCASDSIAIVYNQGWSLGFEGTGGELVILIDMIDSIKPRRTGVAIDLETGEHVFLRFHGRQVGIQAGEPAQSEGGEDG